ncbi:helix-turn-helix domain-containing protein [Burkholderia gladioli]|uniref:helix-turn-helix domain-containing protein n=1 Tax=Burkholderia gladioli TaxID=28095 RepID=UPI001641E395
MFIFDIAPLALTTPVQDADSRTHGLGRSIRRLRRHRDLTLEEVATSVGISRSFLSQIERTRAAPSLTTLEAIARALNVTPEYFFAAAVDEPGVARRSSASVVRFTPAGGRHEPLRS